MHEVYHGRFSVPGEGLTARSQILGDGTGGTITDVRTVTAQQNHPGRVTETIYGRIFANQDPSIGSYSDTIIYTVNF